MRIMNKVLVLMMLVLLGACSSVKIDKSQKVIEPSQLKEPYKMLDVIIEKEAILPDWYNSEEPSHYLTTRQIIKKGGKDEAFLNGLKAEGKIATEDDIDKFNDLAQSYLNKLSRKYKLKDENIKNTKGVVEKLVLGYNMQFPTLAKHMMTDVATESERETIQKLNVKAEDDMTDKDRKTVRKLLNKWLKRDEFFDAESMYSSEISTATIALVELAKTEDLTSLQKSNLNAKALQLAFPELISPLGRWGK